MASRSGLGRAMAVLASGTLVSRLLGFGRSWLLVQAIGATGFVSSAYSTANSAPNTIFAIVSQGVLNAVLIPQLVRAGAHRDGGQRYINKLVTLGIVVFGCLTLVATLLSPQLMTAFGIRGPHADLAVAFAYWSLPQIFFYGLYTLLGEVLNARKSFGPFTWAPVLNNVVSLAFLGVFIWAYGVHDVDSIGTWPPLKTFVLAGGATIGIAAQAVVLFAFWRRVGLSFRFDFRWRGMELRSVGKAAGWTFAMLLCTQLAGWFQTVVANTVTEPHLAGYLALSTTWLIFMLPYSIVSLSIVTAYFTRMSEHARDGELESFKTDYSAAVRSNTLIVSFCAAALILTAVPVSRVFTPDYSAFAGVLIMFLLGLVPFTIGFVTLRAFYSLGDTRSPFVYTLVQSLIVAVGLCLCLLLPHGIRVAGIALVVSIAGTIQALLAMVFLRRRLRGLELRGIVRSVVTGFLAAAAASLIGFVVLRLLGAGGDGGWGTRSIGTAIVSTIAISVVMLVAYVLALRLLRVQELRELTGALQARIRRSRRSE